MMKVKKYFSKIQILFASIIGCTAMPQKEMNHLQNIIVDKKTDWGGNFKLHIQSKVAKDTSYVYKVCASDSGTPIGFELEVPVRINKFGAGVIFRSLGDTSDNFLQSLFSIYGLKPQGIVKFIYHTSCNYASLNDLTFKGDGQKRLKTVNYLKVFFEGTKENEYAELYVNIDETNKMIEFEEKDFEYRPYVAYFLISNVRK